MKALYYEARIFLHKLWKKIRGKDKNDDRFIY